MAQLDSYLEHKAKVLATRRDELNADPETSLVELSARSHIAGNTGIRPILMGDYIINSDSGPGLAGHALGPSSPELALGALASCLVHSYLLQAAIRDIAIDHVEIEVTGAIDMAPVVGIGDDVEISLQNLKYKPIVQSPAPQAEIDKLHAEVERTCAVLNTFRRPQVVQRV